MDESQRARGHSYELMLWCAEMNIPLWYSSQVVWSFYVGQLFEALTPPLHSHPFLVQLQC